MKALYNKFSVATGIVVQAKYIIFSAFLLMLISTPQKVWTLQECLQFSKKNNLNIQQHYYEREKFHLRSNYTRGRFLPVVDGRWRSANNWGFLIDPSTNILDRRFNFGNLASINANWDIFNGQFTNAITRLRSHELAIAQYTYESAINTNGLQVTELYLQALLSHEQLKVAKLQILQLQKQQKLLQQQLAKGVSNKRDVLNIHSQLASEELQVVYAENRLEKAVFDLMHTIGLYQDSLIQISMIDIPDSLSVIYYSDETYSSDSEQNFSELKAAQAQVDIANTAVVVARNHQLPVLSLHAQLATRTSSFQKDEFNNQLRNNFNQQIGLTLVVPIFNYVTQNNIEIAKVELESAKISYHQVRAELKQQIFSAKLDYKAAYRKLIASQTGYKSLTEEYRFAEKQLQLGLITAIEYGEVRNRFFASQSEFLQNKYGCFFKLKILEYFQGKGLD
jgi:outer membrane protein